MCDVEKKTEEYGMYIIYIIEIYCNYLNDILLNVVMWCHTQAYMNSTTRYMNSIKNRTLALLCSFVCEQSL